MVCLTYAKNNVTNAIWGWQSACHFNLKHNYRSIWNDSPSCSTAFPFSWAHCFGPPMFPFCGKKPDNIEFLQFVSFTFKTWNESLFTDKTLLKVFYIFNEISTRIAFISRAQQRSPIDSIPDGKNLQEYSILNTAIVSHTHLLVCYWWRLLKIGDRFL